MAQILNDKSKVAANKAHLLDYSSFFRSLADKYGDMPLSMVQDAYIRAMPFGSAYTNNPFVQNRRVKAAIGLPRDVSKNQIVDMLQAPDENESGLRQVSHILEYTAFPLQKIRTTYQDLCTYRYFIYPAYLENKSDIATETALLREWRLCYKLADKMQIRRVAHQIVGQCIQDGKVFYYPRVNVDKSHNAVDSAFMQQMPQNWIKITGYNNISKYTVAFNMMYFLQPGTTFRHYGTLFEPYVKEFLGIFTDRPRISPKGLICASTHDLDVQNLLKQQKRMRENGSGEVFCENGTWFYWVYLPPEEIWTFEIDDTKPVVTPPLTGLFLSMAQIAQYEQVQLEIVQNPLVSMVLGEIETYDSVTPTTSDPYKLSPTSRDYFQSLFYQTMAENNTGGIAIYSAPFKNMQLAQLAEAPNATNISSAGYEYAMEKSGMSALIPTNSDARAGVAQISLQIESRYAEHIYWQIESMINWLIKTKLKPVYEWRFRMFGNLASDDAARKEAKDGLTLGILPMALKYAALNDMSLLDDLSISLAVESTGIMGMRNPLVSSYTAKHPDSGLPPFGENPQGGRPKNEDGVSTDGNEGDVDDASGANQLLGRR